MSVELIAAMVWMRILRHLLFVLISLSGALALAHRVALVVIDMQPYFFENKRFYFLPENQEAARKVLERQAFLIQIARENRVPIIKIEYKDFGDTHPFLNSEIGDYDLTRTFLKNSDGMFDAYRGNISTELHNHLTSLGVTDLVISGANGGYCVRCSIEGALRRNYRVWADNLAIIDFNTFPFAHPYVYKEGSLRVDAGLTQKHFSQTKDLSTVESILKGNFPNHVREQSADDRPQIPPTHRPGSGSSSIAVRCADIYLTQLYLIGD